MWSGCGPFFKVEKLPWAFRKVNRTVITAHFIYNATITSAEMSEFLRLWSQSKRADSNKGSIVGGSQPTQRGIFGPEKRAKNSPTIKCLDCTSKGWGEIFRVYFVCLILRFLDTVDCATQFSQVRWELLHVSLSRWFLEVCYNRDGGQDCHGLFGHRVRLIRLF